MGVNVSSAGNQLSFLVPAERVANLLAEYLDGQQDDTELLTIVARQFKALHEDLLGSATGPGSAHDPAGPVPRTHGD